MKTKTESDKMKIDLRPKPGDKARRLVPVIGFSFASYPVRINRVFFRCVSGVAISQTKSHDLRRRVFGRVSP